jgi:hypothetical protein
MTTWWPTINGDKDQNKSEIFYIFGNEKKTVVQFEEWR